MTLGELIKQYRKDNGLSLRDLAQRARISNSYLSMLENGRKSSTKQPIVPTLTKLNQLADAMGLRVDDLVAMIDDIPIDLDNSGSMRVPVSDKAKKTIASNILAFMSFQKLTVSDVCKDLGFKPSTFNNWINSRNYPPIGCIEMMADYFGISMGALIDKPGTDLTISLTPHERIVMHYYRCTDQSTTDIVDKILGVDEFEKETQQQGMAFLEKFTKNLSDDSKQRLVERAKELQELDDLKRNLEKKKDSE